MDNITAAVERLDQLLDKIDRSRKQVSKMLRELVENVGYPADTRLEGFYETGCFTEKGNDFCLFVGSDALTYKELVIFYNRLLEKFPNSEAGDVLGMIDRQGVPKQVYDFAELELFEIFPWFVLDYQNQTCITLGKATQKVIREDFLRWMLRGYHGWLLDGQANQKTATVLDSADKEAIAALKRCKLTDTKLYLPSREEVIFPPVVFKKLKLIVEKAGGKWVMGKQHFVFDRDPREIFSQVFESGKAVNVQKDLQAFYTPDDLAAHVVALAGVEPGMKVLEPSCGDGAILRHILAAGAEPVGIELDSHAAAVTSKECQVEVQVADFLTVKPTTEYDVVCMNPPFNKEQWAKHLLHAWTFLKSGGKLVCITPSNHSGKWADKVAQLIAAHGTTEDVAEKAFQESGTNIKTKIVILTKP